MPKQSPDPFYTLRGHSGPVSAVHFFSSKLYSGSGSGEIYAWDLETFKKATLFHDHDRAGILWIGHVSDALVTQGRDGTIGVWKESTGSWQKHATLQTTSKGFCQCSALKSSSPLLASPHGDDDTAINLWNLDTCTVVITVKPSGSEKVGMVMCTRLCRDGNLLVAGYENGSVISFDCRSGKPISSVVCFKHPVMCMDIDDCHRMKGLCGSVTKTLCAFEDFQDLRLSKEVAVVNEGFASTAIRSDGKIAASGGWDGRIRIFSWRTLKPLAVLNFHDESVQSVDFAAERVRREGVGVLAAGAKDGIVSLWSVYTD
ncbi:guanine nucleotide-binding protein subunit beta-like protein 1 [Ornithodoros turicata]|uniref:guanine nucleotide-binding protein subunit beta-like protein 1 n=1 Tax=Ornithodoros turicata TaxID=34597 RepID=UPI00313942A3